MKTRKRFLFFELALSTKRFQDQIQNWSCELEIKWLQNKRVKIKDNFVGVENPEKIWLEHRRDERGIPNDVWNGGPPGYPKARERPNKDHVRLHAWAKKILEAMPRFSPMIMFQLCEEKCYTNMGRERLRQLSR